MASLSRRSVLQLAGLGATALGSAALGGCRSTSPTDPQLFSLRGVLPQPWLKTLPAPWRSRLFERPEELLALAQQPLPGPALLALNDGWVQELAVTRLQPLQVDDLLAQLDPIAAAASRLFQPEGAPARALPWAFGTWVLLLRDRGDLLRRGDEGWALLLDPSLRRKLVLPSSPRILIELALRQLQSRTAATAPAAALPSVEDPRLPAQLRALQRQALALDEVDGLNQLLAGEAEAAVVTSQQALPLLLRDPRLEAFLPASGSPLWWQLLVLAAPASAPDAAPAGLPLPWLGAGMHPPLLDRLLAAGWVPPLQRRTLQGAVDRWPQRLRPLLLPPPAVLERCSNLPPFSPAERQRWQQVWDQAMAG